MTGPFRYVRTRWPEAEIPEGEAEWFYEELDEPGDRVVRSVEVFPDGRINRNSIELEERGGRPCPSLIDLSLAEGFDGVDLEDVERDVFEDLWAKGVDTPFWNV